MNPVKSVIVSIQILSTIVFGIDKNKKKFSSTVNFVDENYDEKYSSTNLFSVTKTRRWRAKTNIWW